MYIITGGDKLKYSS